MNNTISRRNTEKEESISSSSSIEELDELSLRVQELLSRDPDGCETDVMGEHEEDIDIVESVLFAGHENIQSQPVCCSDFLLEQDNMNLSFNASFFDERSQQSENSDKIEECEPLNLHIRWRPLYSFEEMKTVSTQTLTESQVTSNKNSGFSKQLTEEKGCKIKFKFPSDDESTSGFFMPRKFMDENNEFLGMLFTRKKECKLISLEGAHKTDNYEKAKMNKAVQTEESFLTGESEEDDNKWIYEKSRKKCEGPISSTTHSEDDDDKWIYEKSRKKCEEPISSTTHDKTVPSPKSVDDKLQREFENFSSEDYDKWIYERSRKKSEESISSTTHSEDDDDKWIYERSRKKCEEPISSTTHDKTVPSPKSCDDKLQREFENISSEDDDEKWIYEMSRKKCEEPISITAHSIC